MRWSNKNVEEERANRPSHFLSLLFFQAANAHTHTPSHSTARRFAHSAFIKNCVSCSLSCTNKQHIPMFARQHAHTDVQFDFFLLFRTYISCAWISHSFRTRIVRLCACLELVILFYSILFIHLVFVRCLFVCTQIQRYFLSCSLVRPRIYISSLFLLKIHKLMLNMNLLLLLLLLRALLYPTTKLGILFHFCRFIGVMIFSFGLCGAAHTSPSSLPRRSIDSIS